MNDVRYCKNRQAEDSIAIDAPEDTLDFGTEQERLKPCVGGVLKSFES